MIELAKIYSVKVIDKIKLLARTDYAFGFVTLVNNCLGMFLEVENSQFIFSKKIL